MNKPKFVCPHSREVVEKDKINEKVEKVEILVTKFKDDLSELNKNHETSESELNKTFEDLTKDLLSRREFLLNEAKKKYDMHYDQINYYIKQLETYKDNINDARDKMCETVMEEKETKERIDKNVKMMKDALKLEPIVKEVPVDIKFDNKYYDRTKSDIKQTGQVILKDLDVGKQLNGKEMKTLNAPKLPSLAIVSIKRNKQAPEKVEITYRIDNMEEAKNSENNIEPLSVILNNSKIEFAFNEDIFATEKHDNDNNNDNDNDEEKEGDIPGEMDDNNFSYCNLNSNDNGAIKTILIDNKKFELHKLFKVTGRIIYARNVNNLLIPKQDQDNYDINNQKFKSSWSSPSHVGYAIMVAYNNQQKVIEVAKNECNTNTIASKIKETFKELDNNKIQWKCSLKDSDNNIVIDDLLIDNNLQFSNIFNGSNMIYVELVKQPIQIANNGNDVDIDFLAEYHTGVKLAKKRVTITTNDINAIKEAVKKTCKELNDKDFKMLLGDTEINHFSQLPLIAAPKGKGQAVVKIEP